MCGLFGNEYPILEYLNQYKAEDTELTVRNIGQGTNHMEYLFYQSINHAEILKQILQAEKEGFDGGVLNCFYDAGLMEAREITKNMVITAPAEASMYITSVLGYRFSVIVGRKEWIPQIRDNLRKYGLEDKLASFHSVEMGVLEFHENGKETKRRLREELRRAIEEDGTEVIILGCTMQFGFYQELQEEFSVPVIDSMIAGAKHAEYLIELGKKLG